MSHKELLKIRSQITNPGLPYHKSWSKMVTFLDMFVEVFPFLVYPKLVKRNLPGPRLSLLHHNHIPRETVNMLIQEPCGINTSSITQIVNAQMDKSYLYSEFNVKSKAMNHKKTDFSHLMDLATGVRVYEHSDLGLDCCQGAGEYAKKVIWFSRRQELRQTICTEAGIPVESLSDEWLMKIVNWDDCEWIKNEKLIESMARFAFNNYGSGSKKKNKRKV